ncbi:extracellular solute-binding protein [Streptomyces sp. NPDC059785]|uniref:extracellular solute-binding protein n=1 Tax=Streptomyces sp. NPDC059785 TaxID=3346945 RepID=UPI003669FB3E
MNGRGARALYGTGRGALVGALVLVLSAVAACGGGAPVLPPSGDTPGVIVVASGRDVTGKDGVRQQLIDAWNAEQERRGTNYSARLVELPGSADEQRSQLLGALQSGSAEYDVVNLDVTWVPEFAAAGLIRPLPGDLLDKDVIGSVASTAKWDGEVYAAPFNSDVGLLFYRPDYLKRVGAQRTDLGRGVTWPELRALSDTLDDSEERPARYEKGWTTQLGPYEGRTVNAVEAFASAVPDFALTDDEGRYTASVEELTDGLAELRARSQAPYTLPGAKKSDETASMTDFADGRTAFLRQWPYAYRTLHQSFPAGRLAVAPLPGKAVLGGQNLAVTDDSKRGRTATDLIRFLTDQRSERCLLDGGFAATRRSAYEADDVTCRFTGPSGTATPSPTASASAESADRMPRDAQGRPRYARGILLPALRRAVQRPRTPLYGAFTQTFATELGPLFTDAPPTDAALARSLDKALRDVLPDG